MIGAAPSRSRILGVSLINAWSSPGVSGGGAIERRAVMACDGCLPPSLMIASTAEQLLASGWRFAGFETGPHYCPVCRRARGRAPRRRCAVQQRPALPNLLIIGSGKCGTSSLHWYLAAHPEIQMSDVKELKHFHDPDWDQKLDTYAGFFDGNAPIRGESTPSYTLHPLSPDIPERIAATVPDVKLVYLVRDPIERTISHFLERAQVWHRDSFERDFGDIGDPYNVYVAGGRYATQVERYLRVFSREQLLVVDQADLLATRREALREIFRFLGVDEDASSPRYDVVHNPGHRKVRWRQTGRRLARSRTAAAVRRVVPERPRETLFAPAKRLTTRKLETPKIDDETRNGLREAFLPEVERLRELTGKRFASWQL
jgi:Sulfotransferase domain